MRRMKSVSLILLFLFGLITFSYSEVTPLLVNCGYDLGSSNDYTEVSSPNAPGHYPNNANCVWRKNVTFDRGYVVRAVLLQRILIEDNDYLEFRDGPNANSPLLARITGHIDDGDVPYITASSESMWIGFKSDGSGAGSGFRFAVYPITPSIPPTPRPTSEPIETTVDDGGPTTEGPPLTPNCGRDYVLASADIKSPGFPRNYPDNTECIWRMNVTQGSGQIVQVWFQTQTQLDIADDFLEFRDGPDENSPLLKRLTGFEFYPQRIYATGCCLWVKFKSNGSNNGKGFNFITSNYATQPTRPTQTTSPYTTTTERPEPTTTPVPTTTIATTTTATTATTATTTTTSGPPPFNCSRDYYQNDGYFGTPNFPSNYPNNADCIWRFFVTVGSKVEVNFVPGGIDFGDCNGCDSLEFRDGPNSDSSLLAHFTSIVQNPPSVFSSTNILWTRFRTDNTGSSSGFYARFHTGR